MTERAPIRVLIVEDHPAVARLLRRMLDGREGFRVTADVPSLAGLFTVALSDVDVVLLDQYLLDGTGIEAARLIRGERPDLPIVMLSAMPCPALDEGLAALGIDTWLTKGHVRLEHVSETLRTAVARHVAATPGAARSRTHGARHTADAAAAREGRAAEGEGRPAADARSAPDARATVEARPAVRAGRSTERAY